MDVDVFRRGLFALRTRRLGRVAEILIRNSLSLSPALNNHHDLYDGRTDELIEVKSGVVYQKHPVSITPENVMEVIEHSANWVVEYAERDNYQFDINIQQIKPAEFDHLYYGLFFYDEVLFFKMTSTDVVGDPKLSYSPHQHKGNVGEGQFHIDQKSLPYHVEEYLYSRLTYEELLDFLSK